MQTLIDAVGAYHGKAGLLIQAAALGVGTHAFNNLIYVCAARALGVELSLGEVFFASSLQILATLIPASINGIGLREAAAVALYTSPAIGLPLAVAVLIPTLGFACEMFVSAFGGFIFLLRKTGYDPGIRVEDPDREKLVAEAIPKAPREAWPHPWRGLLVGFSAGVFGGALVGLGEATVIALSSAGATGVRVFFYGPLAYGLFCGAFGAGLGFATALSGRLMKRYALPETEAFGYFAAAIFGLFAFALGAFRIRRDLFHEESSGKARSGSASSSGARSSRRVSVRSWRAGFVGCWHALRSSWSRSYASPWRCSPWSVLLSASTSQAPALTRMRLRPRSPMRRPRAPGAFSSSSSTPYARTACRPMATVKDPLRISIASPRTRSAFTALLRTRAGHDRASLRSSPGGFRRATA